MSCLNWITLITYHVRKTYVLNAKKKKNYEFFIFISNAILWLKQADIMEVKGRMASITHLKAVW